MRVPITHLVVRRQVKVTALAGSGERIDHFGISRG
jgi:hypothetical protein